jgi:hypothetical protein
LLIPNLFRHIEFISTGTRKAFKDGFESLSSGMQFLHYPLSQDKLLFPSCNDRSLAVVVTSVLREFLMRLLDL